MRINGQSGNFKKGPSRTEGVSSVRKIGHGTKHLSKILQQNIPGKDAPADKFYEFTRTHKMINQNDELDAAWEYYLAYNEELTSITEMLRNNGFNDPFSDVDPFGILHLCASKAARKESSDLKRLNAALRTFVVDETQELISAIQKAVQMQDPFLSGLTAAYPMAAFLRGARLNAGVVVFTDPEEVNKRHIGAANWVDINDKTYLVNLLDIANIRKAADLPPLISPDEKSKRLDELKKGIDLEKWTARPEILNHQNAQKLNARQMFSAYQYLTACKAISERRYFDAERSLIRSLEIYDKDVLDSLGLMVKLGYMMISAKMYELPNQVVKDMINNKLPEEMQGRMRRLQSSKSVKMAIQQIEHDLNKRNEDVKDK